MKKTLILQTIVGAYKNIAPMLESDFHKLADAWLSMAEDALEGADQVGALEIESQNGTLTIEMPAGKTLVISKHAPSKQLWLASPLSGGLHFSQQNGRWTLADGRAIEEVISGELRQLAQVEITW